MVPTEFKALIDQYKRAIQGDLIDDNQLFAQSVSFLENLKFALQEGSLTRKEGMAMIGLLRHHSTEYDEKRSLVHKPVRSIKETEVRRALKKRLAVLVKDLGQFFQEGTSDEVSQDLQQSSLNKTSKAKKRPHRLARKNWVRS